MFPLVYFHSISCLCPTARLSETAAAYVAGRLEDTGSSKQEIACFASAIGVSLFFFWSIYHVLGFGAADERFNAISEEDEKWKPLVVKDGVEEMT